MSDSLRILLILVSFCTAYWMIRKIRKMQVRIEDTIFWIIFSPSLFLLSIFPSIAEWASRVIGIQSASNFVFLFVIFILLLKAFLLSIKISQLENRINVLVQNLALKENELWHYIKSDK